MNRALVCFALQAVALADRGTCDAATYRGASATCGTVDCSGQSIITVNKVLCIARGTVALAILPSAAKHQLLGVILIAAVSQLIQ